WPNKIIATKSNFTDDKVNTSSEAFGTEPFQCAKSSSSPCPQNGTCKFISSYNDDLVGMYRNQWNITCDCPEPGYIFRYDVNLCVDINECMYINCEETEGENMECANLKGSYKCICKLGYIPVGNSCVPVTINTKLFWGEPKISSGVKNKIHIIIVLAIFINLFVTM
ncbi:unnamed protein product, partial [Thelazia callipaeda]|uniref:EGF-like domain-containing protein n=1 Tax=Thelazia callipaeda TaxID=103827 RepID=A0A0N5DB21_THECL